MHGNDISLRLVPALRVDIDLTPPPGRPETAAVPARSRGSSHADDANGNMTGRMQEDVTWTQVFDAQNRLVSVSNNTTPSTTMTYMYDGGRGRLKRIGDDGSTLTTTLYVARMEIETADGNETKRTVYYARGGTFRIIGDSDAGLDYRHRDCLGSTSVFSDANGMRVARSDMIYAPLVRYVPAARAS